jgi:hypothetical protein
MAKLKEIHWKRLSIEAVAIVGSILMAFAIDAWWDERQLRIGEVEVLMGLKEEFQRNRDVLLESVESTHANMLLSTQELMEACRRGFWESDNFAIDEAISYLQYPPTHDFGGGVLAALISSGRLEIISENDLRNNLAGWSVIFDEIRDDEVWNSNFVFDRVEPYILRWHIPVSRGYEMDYDFWPVPSRSITDDAGSVTRLFSDPEFEVLLEIRYESLYHTSGEYQTALQKMQDILEQINARLAEL